MNATTKKNYARDRYITLADFQPVFLKKKKKLTVGDGHGRDGDVAALDLAVTSVPNDPGRGFRHPDRALQLERLILLDFDFALRVAGYLHRLRWRCNKKGGECV